MRMDERKFLILQAIIDDYIMTAVPVGSRTISRKAGVGFSPATIRNEMSDLEELGYLDQPHTSAGRVPSTKAYRLYVDHLLKVTALSEADAQRITLHMKERASQVEELVRGAAKILSDVTRYTSVAVTPQLETLRIKRVSLVPINESSALVIIVTNAGILKDTMVSLPEGIQPAYLFRLSEMLTQQLADCTLSQVRQRFAEIFRDLKENRKLMAGILDVLEHRLLDQQPGNVLVGGSSNLLSYPEYADVEKARNFLAVLESKEKLYPLLTRPGGMEFTIRIGPENDLPELSDCSVVTATYRAGEDVTGTLGIIGPTRMHYGKVISVLSYISQALSDLLAGENSR